MLKSALSIFLFSCLLGRLDCTDNEQLTVKRGENATLQCRSSRGAAVVMLKWRKPDLQSQQELYVFYIKNNINYEIFQLPSFKGRVQLRDPEMKDGDFSVILKNVSMNDAAIYECHAGYGKPDDVELLSTINLKVVESGQTGGQSGNGGNEDEGHKGGGDKSGSVGLIVGLSVLTVLVVAAVVGFMIYRRRRTQSDPDYQPPAEQGTEMSSVSPAAVPGSQQPVQHSE